MFGKNKQLGVKNFTDGGIVTLTTDPFYTIQGEGIYSGRPAIFVRYAGCNLACSFCDTDFEKQNRISVNELVNNLVNMIQTVGSNVCNLVVITGGEPFIHASLCKLVKKLLNEDILVQIETAGTVYQQLPFNDTNLTIVCSPKTTINYQIKDRVDYYKVIVSNSTTEVNENKGLPKTIIQGTKSVRLRNELWSGLEDFPRSKIYISPMDEYDPVKNKLNLKLVGKICMKYGYTAGVQLHKCLELD